MFGFINLTRLVYAGMKARGGGVIINDIGAAGEKFDFDYIAGSAGNAGLMAFTRALGSKSLKDNIRVVGINQADQPDNARRFLGRYGNPFAAVGVDPNRRASIEWGVYGVPETFVVGRDGRIAYKLIGEITERNLETTLRPQIEKALSATPSS